MGKFVSRRLGVPSLPFCKVKRECKFNPHSLDTQKGALTFFSFLIFGDKGHQYFSNISNDAAVMCNFDYQEPRSITKMSWSLFAKVCF